MADRQLVQVAENETVADVEIRVAIFLRGISEIAEVATILRSQICVRCNIQGMGPSVRGKKSQSVRETLLDPGLQRVVIRKARRAEPANESVELGQGTVHGRRIGRSCTTGLVEILADEERRIESHARIRIRSGLVAAVEDAIAGAQDQLFL